MDSRRPIHAISAIFLYILLQKLENIHLELKIEIKARYQKPERNVMKTLCVCAQSCPTLWDPMDCNLPGSSIQRLFQARILEWVAVSSSGGTFQPRY